jgi:hypothetical protein
MHAAIDSAIGERLYANRGRCNVASRCDCDCLRFGAVCGCEEGAPPAKAARILVGHACMLGLKISTLNIHADIRPQCLPEQNAPPLRMILLRISFG